MDTNTKAAAILAASMTVGAAHAAPPDYSKMTKPELVNQLYTKAEAVCTPAATKGVALKESFTNVAHKIHEPDLRKLLEKGVTLCLDPRQTAPGTWDMTSKTIWGAFYNDKEFGKILALSDDGKGNSSFSPLNRIAEAVTRFNSHNVADQPQNTPLYGTAQSVVGSIIGGSRDNRQYVQWEPAAGVADQVTSKGLATPPVAHKLPAFSPPGS